jgi:hypothetical protein
MEEEEGTLVEDEEEPKTPSQLALEGEDKENTNKKCCESNNHSLLNCGIKTNAGHHHMSVTIGTHPSEDN